MLTDHNLTEAVLSLQRRDLAPEARQVVDEAVRLLGEGREGEARALYEKAEALASLHNPMKGSAGNGHSVVKVNGSNGPVLQGIVAPLAAKLATGFTNVLTSVLEDIHRYTGDQIQVVAQSLQEHIEHMEAALRDVSSVGERLEQLANDQQSGLQSVQHGQQELWDAVRALQESDRQQKDSITRVATTTEELSHHMADQVDAVATRFTKLEERVNALDRFAEQMPPKLAGIMARLDGQTDSLRVLEERQSQRVSTLNQVLDSLAKLRESESDEMAMQAIA